MSPHPTTDSRTSDLEALSQRNPPRDHIYHGSLNVCVRSHCVAMVTRGEFRTGSCVKELSAYL